MALPSKTAKRPRKSLAKFPSSSGVTLCLRAKPRIAKSRSSTSSNSDGLNDKWSKQRATPCPASSSANAARSSAASGSSKAPSALSVTPPNQRVASDTIPSAPCRPIASDALIISARIFSAACIMRRRVSKVASSPGSGISLSSSSTACRR